MKTMAFVHSLQQEGNPEKGDFGHQQAEVTIVSHKSSSEVTAEYNGVLCKATYNPITGAYYVDDVYGKIT